MQIHTEVCIYQLLWKGGIRGYEENEDEVIIKNDIFHSYLV